MTLLAFKASATSARAWGGFDSHALPPVKNGELQKSDSSATGPGQVLQPSVDAGRDPLPAATQPGLNRDGLTPQNRAPGMHLVCTAPPAALPPEVAKLAQAWPGLTARERAAILALAGVNT